MNKEDLQLFCDDVSAWIVELGLEGELEKASSVLKLPLTVEDVVRSVRFDVRCLEEGVSSLAYLVLWMSLKSKQRAPSHLESRLMMYKVSGPWVKMYIKHCKILEKNLVDFSSIDIFTLAS